MSDTELIGLLASQLETLNYYTEFLQIIPGVQEPDCSKLFQAKSDLISALSRLEVETGDVFIQGPGNWRISEAVNVPSDKTISGKEGS